jgi:hypothetical protein
LAKPVSKLIAQLVEKPDVTLNWRELVRDKGLVFSPDVVAALLGPGVYLLVQNDEAVYVGVSRVVVGRAFARNHQKLQAFRDAGTSLVVFPCETYNSAKRLESQLIAILHPSLNRRNSEIALVDHIAEKLGIKRQMARKHFKRFQEGQRLAA